MPLQLDEKNELDNPPLMDEIVNEEKAEFPLNPDFLEFCGNHVIDFNNIDFDVVNFLVTELQSGKTSYTQLIVLLEKRMEESFKNGTRIIQHIVFAFSQGKITIEQATTFLELREMQLTFSRVRELPLLDAEETSFSAVFIEHNFISPQENKALILEELKKLHPIERVYFAVNITSGEREGRLGKFLELAGSLRIISIPDNPTTPILWSQEGHSDLYLLSTGARQAILRVRFGVHAKPSMPCLGLLSDEDLERSIRNKRRYLSVSYPGIPDSPTFHGIVAKPFYLNLHDKLHEALFSSVPNPTVDAAFCALDLVREKTGISEFPSGFKFIDMDTDVFLKSEHNKHDFDSPQTRTEAFIDLLNSPIFSTQASGLFAHGSDVSWLLVIDWVQNPGKWAQHGIDFRFLHGHLRWQYDVCKNQDFLKNSPAQQVALLMAPDQETYYNLAQKTEFIVDSDGDIRVMVNSKIFRFSKSFFLPPDLLPSIIDREDDDYGFEEDGAPHT